MLALITALDARKKDRASRPEHTATRVKTGRYGYAGGVEQQQPKDSNEDLLANADVMCADENTKKGNL